MVSAIPSSFDYEKEMLDPYERYIRDNLMLNVEEWVKFRWIISCGTSKENIHGRNAGSKNVIDSYLEIGKCNYEVICSLGYCKVSLNKYSSCPNDFEGQKSIKDFYFHAGAVLDNLSRIIFIVMVKDAASKEKNGSFVRHRIDRGELLSRYKDDIPQTYYNEPASDEINKITNIRNIITHYWKIPQNKDRWPRSELASKKALAWPYCEPDYANYSDWTPIKEILEDNFTSLVRLQDKIYGMLVSDITIFETNNDISIVSPA